MRAFQAISRFPEAVRQRCIVTLRPRPRLRCSGGLEVHWVWRAGQDHSSASRSKFSTMLLLGRNRPVATAACRLSASIYIVWQTIPGIAVTLGTVAKLSVCAAPHRAVARSEGAAPGDRVTPTQPRSMFHPDSGGLSGREAEGPPRRRPDAGRRRRVPHPLSPLALRAHVDPVHHRGRGHAAVSPNAYDLGRRLIAGTARQPNRVVLHPRDKVKDKAGDRGAGGRAQRPEDTPRPGTPCRRHQDRTALGIYRRDGHRHRPDRLVTALRNRIAERIPARPMLVGAQPA